MGKICKLFKRIYSLIKFNPNHQQEINYKIFEAWFYNQKKLIKFPQKLKIMSEMESVELLIKNPKTFIRFGDGEISIINGSRNCTQKYEKKLAKFLNKILSENSDSYYKAIPNFYDIPADLNSNQIEYRKTLGFYFLNLFEKYCNENELYLNTEISYLYMRGKSNVNLDTWYRQISRIFMNKEVVLFSGKDILNKLEFNFFNFFKIKFINYECPTTNAFDEYKKIFKKCKKIDNSFIFCFAIGPTSKILCYKLNKLGYLCFDIGHLLQDFNAYKCKLNRNYENVKTFFSPD